MCVYVCAYIRICYANECMYECMDACVYVCVRICVCINTCVDIYVRARKRSIRIFMRI